MKKLIILLVLPFSALAQQSMNVNLLYNWTDTTLVSSIAFGNAYNEIWGVAINGREYAIIGTTMGTHFFDVTDPVNSVQVDFVPGALQGTSIIGRDYHDYRGYLYMVSSDGNSTLQIADLSYLPDSVSIVHESNSLIQNAHNIFIDTATAKLYAVDVAWYENFTTYQSDLRVLSLADPINPTLVFDYDYPPMFHDLYVRNDTVIVNHVDSGLSIFDFSDTTNPQLIGSLTAYPDQGINHAGWLNEDGTIYAFVDETHGMDVKVCDGSDLTNITVVSQINSGVDINSIAHNLIIKGDYLYIAYFHDGLYIYDISNPANPILKGYYDTYASPGHDSFRGAYGIYPLLPSGNVLVSDMQYGLFVLDVEDATIINDHTAVIDNVLIHPNPFLSKLTIEMHGNSGDKGSSIFFLYDLLGRELHRVEQIENIETDVQLGHLPSGLYIYAITSEKRILSRGKIVKE